MPILFPNLHIAFYDTPKVASTSIKLALHKLDNDEELVQDRPTEAAVHRQYKTLPLTGDPKADFPEGYWKFALVRDPMKRMLSAYSNRVVHHKDQLRGHLHRTRALLLGLPLAPDAETFFVSINRYRLLSGSIRHHTSEAQHWIGSDLSKLDAIFPMEALDELAAELSRRTGKQAHIPRLQTGGPKLTLDMLSPQAYAALLKYTRAEYELLKDFYQPPAYRGGEAKPAQGARPVAAPARPLTWALCTPTLNRIDVLETSVTLALGQTRPPAEIVIVDAGEDWQENAARIRKLVAPSGIPLRYLPSPRKSLPYQRNLAIREATADILFLIDDDSFLFPDAAAEVLALYEADPEERLAAIAVSPTSENPAGSTVGTRKEGATDGARGESRKGSGLKAFFMREVALMHTDRRFVPYDNGRYHSRASSPEGTRPLNLISGYRLTVRRSVAERELFDDGLEAYSPAEDLDATYRFSRHGALVTALRARLHHHEAAANRLKRRTAKVLGLLNVAYFVRKNATPQWRGIFGFYILALRTVLAEAIKDISTRRWELPQTRGTIAAIARSISVFRRRREDLLPWYTEVQQRILGWK